MCSTGFAILAHEGPSPETIQQAERGVASPRAGRRGYEKPGAVARHEQWLAAGSLLAGSAERVRSGSWADNATVERREAASRLHGTGHASQAWCRASQRDS